MAKLLKNVLVSAEIVTLNHSNKQQEMEAPPIPVGQDVPTHEQLEHAYQEGYLCARNEAANAAGQHITEHQQQLAALLHSIPQAVADNRLALHKDIADIVALITRNYFISQEQQPATLEQQINNILSQINSQQRVELCLHPQDVSLLKDGTISLSASHLNGLKIKSDDSLILGGCIVKTEHGLFDASIEKQIDKLKEALIGIRQGRLHASATK